MEEAALPSFSVLPTELLVEIFGYFTGADLGRAGQVCKVWRQVADNAGHWKRLAESADTEISEEGSWRERAIAAYDFPPCPRDVFLPTEYSSLTRAAITRAEGFDGAPTIARTGNKTFIFGLRQGALTGHFVGAKGEPLHYDVCQPPLSDALTAVGSRVLENGDILLLVADASGEVCPGLWPFDAAEVSWGRSASIFEEAIASLHLTRDFFIAIRAGKTQAAFGKIVDDTAHRLDAIDGQELRYEGVAYRGEQCRLFIGSGRAEHLVFEINGDALSPHGKTSGGRLHPATGIHWMKVDFALLSGKNLAKNIWSSPPPSQYLALSKTANADTQASQSSWTPIRVGPHPAAAALINGSIYVVLWSRQNGWGEGGDWSPLPVSRFDLQATFLSPHVPDLGSFFIESADGHSYLIRLFYEASGPSFRYISEVPSAVAHGCPHILTESEWLVFPEKGTPEDIDETGQGPLPLAPHQQLPAAPPAVHFPVSAMNSWPTAATFCLSLGVTLLLLRYGPSMISDRLSPLGRATVALAVATIVTWAL